MTTNAGIGARVARKDHCPFVFTIPLRRMTISHKMNTDTNDYCIFFPFCLITSKTVRYIEYIYYLLTHGAEPFWRSRQFCSYSRISQHFMEPEGSLQCSQEPSTGPYPEPDPLHYFINNFTILFVIWIHSNYNYN
jgi:hypothetical protein